MKTTIGQGFTLAVAVVALIVSLVLVGCTTYNNNNIVADDLYIDNRVESKPTDVPQEIVEYSQKYVWKVVVNGGSGSGFWVTSNVFMTACHVIQEAKLAKVVDSTDKIEKELAVVSCNMDTDISILQPVEVGSYEDEKQIVRVSKSTPQQGTTVYGAGYPLGLPLTITAGHWQLPMPEQERQIFTAPTISGDSGSPLLVVRDGKVQVVGIRLAVWTMSTRSNGGMFLLPHIAVASTGGQLSVELEALKKQRIMRGPLLW